jgi:hypothetical protein
VVVAAAAIDRLSSGCAWCHDGVRVWGDRVEFGCSRHGAGGGMIIDHWYHDPPRVIS